MVKKEALDKAYSDTTAMLDEITEKKVHLQKQSLLVEEHYQEILYYLNEDSQYTTVREQGALEDLMQGIQHSFKDIAGSYDERLADLDKAYRREEDNLENIRYQQRILESLEEPKETDDGKS